MTAHIFLKNKTEDGELQEIEILGVDNIHMDEFHLSIYGNLTNDDDNTIALPLIGLFLSCEVVGYYMEDM